jgi:hypothetical protein
MKTNPFIKPSLVFAALFAVLAGAKSQANMIANGSFETAAPKRTYDQQPGWVSSGDTEFAPAATWSGFTATDGSQVVVLQGLRSSSSGIRTVTLSLKAGQTYQLSWDTRFLAAYNKLFGFWFSVPLDSTMGLYVSMVGNAPGNTPIYYQGASPSTAAWRNHTVTFTPTVDDPNAQFIIQNYSSPGSTPCNLVYNLVDNVELNAVAPKGWYNASYQHGIPWDISTFPELVAVADAVFPLAINNWTTTSVTFTAVQSGYADVAVYLYNNGWSGNVVHVDSAVDNFNLQAANFYGFWAVANAGRQAANLDWDNDGVPNGIEYFMNAATGFTSNPTMNATKTVTWPNGGNIPSSEYGTGFVVQTSVDLVNWTDVPGTDPNLVNASGSVSYAPN